ncbi:DJ-1/PfpI family protein [Arhodomonas sp. SL1]|uniref:DJ-1/PfpI family protein n=1 Tax=Arhodomonas sp. SL1 TaxID=3425691 RepID=UPI003F884BB4
MVGPEKTRYIGKHGCTVDADIAAAEGATQGFDVVIVPGGYAGSEYVDEPVVIDGNLITSRYPPDLGDFCHADIEAASE